MQLQEGYPLQFKDSAEEINLSEVGSNLLLTKPRRKMKRVLVSLVWLTLLVPTIGSAERLKDDALRLTLPPEFYATPAVEMGIYFDNIVLTQTPLKYRFKVKCDIGNSEAGRWVVTPMAKDVGRHAWSVTVSDPDGKTLAEARTVLQVVPSNAGVGAEMRLLIVGDSLTHATAFPNEIARLFSQPENPTLTMLGTHRPKQAAKGVAHEGYGGWTWHRFVSQYEPEPDGTYRKRSSPFVYLKGEGQPQLDLPHYFDKECGGQRPDFVVFLLGINDCFGAPPNDPAAIDARIDAMFKQADVLLAAFRQAAPTAELGICLTTPPNSRQAAFEANYQDRFTRWGWKRIQHRLVQRQLEKFAAGPKDRMFIVPTQLNLDPVEGYPANNGVHPNAKGYQQIGASIYSWLKWREAGRGR